MALDQNGALFVQQVSQRTGIDPRVLVAWIQSEGAPGNGAGYFNYLNIKTATAQSLGVSVSGSGPAGTAAFGTLANGVNATVREINSLGLGGNRLAGKTPAQAIGAISSTGWASSHYSQTPNDRSTWGLKLANTFAGIFGGSAGLSSRYQGSGTALAVASTAGTGSAADASSYTNQTTTNVLKLASGYQTVKTVVDAGKQAGSGITAVGQFFGSLYTEISRPHFWLRVGEVLAGSVLVLLGVWLLARQIGLQAVSSSVRGVLPDQAAAAAAAAASERQAASDQHRSAVRSEQIAQQKARTSAARANARRARQRARDEATIGAARASNRGRTMSSEQARETRAQAREEAIPF